MPDSAEDKNDLGAIRNQIAELLQGLRSVNHGLQGEARRRALELEAKAAEQQNTDLQQGGSNSAAPEVKSSATRPAGP